MSKLLYKDREKRRREHEILLHARRMIHESGFADLNMDVLADAVGISKPTLYQHFRSKEDLLVRVLVDSFQELEDYLRLTSEPSPLERLKTVLRSILVNHYAEDGLLADFQAELITSTLLSHPDVIVAKRRMMAEVDHMVEEAKACGEISSAFPTTLVGCLLFRLIGLPASVRTADTDYPRDPQALATLIDSVVDIFVRSVASIQGKGSQ